ITDCGSREGGAGGIAAMHDHPPDLVRLDDARRAAEHEAIDEAEGNGVDAQAECQERDDAEREAWRTQETADHRPRTGPKHFHGCPPAFAGPPTGLDVDQPRAVLFRRTEPAARLVLRFARACASLDQLRHGPLAMERQLVVYVVLQGPIAVVSPVARGHDARPGARSRTLESAAAVRRHIFVCSSRARRPFAVSP